MEELFMTVDSFKYLPRLITRFYKMSQVEKVLPVPWTSLPKPLAESRLTLVTSGGLYHKGREQPFDLEREQREPTWGDPSFRTLPTAMTQSELGFSHFHLYGPDILEDMNILLPIHRFQELEADGTIGSLAPHAYSFMGYQGYPPDTELWRERYGPEVAERMHAEEVDCVLLTTA
jgi:D-proline reductase (dithiol) PrdB